MTVREIAIKAGLKKLALGEPATTFLPRELATNGFGLLGIELAHATFVETLPPHHKDPFDRLLVSQAMIEKLPLVSADAIFDQYGIQRLWLGYRMSQGVDTAYLVSLVTKRVDDHAFVVWYDPEGRSLPAHLKLRSGSACHWL